MRQLLWFCSHSAHFEVLPHRRLKPSGAKIMEESSESSSGEESYDSSGSNRSYDGDDAGHNDDSLGETDDDDEGSSDSYDEDEDQDNSYKEYRFYNTPIPPPPPRPLKRPKSGTLDDRISGLPDSLILHILSFLSMKDVVRTGALSKRWRYLWTSASTLVFQTPDVREFDIRKFVTFVDKALVLCKCTSIEKFVLYFRYKNCFASDLNVWIRFATQNNVHELELLLDFRRTRIESYRLPQHLHCNSSLKSLRLNNCEIMPSGVISWRSLKSLTLEGMELGDGVMAQILSGSPSLEFLKLDHFRFSSPLDITSLSLKRLVLKTYWLPEEEEPLFEISASNLQSLELLGHIYRPKFMLRNVSSLVNANLNFTFTYHGRVIDNDYRVQDLLRELLESLKHVSELKIGNCLLEVLSILEVKGVPFPLLSCKCLTLDTRVNKWDTPGIAILLQSLPIMETLVINMAFIDSIGGLGSKLVNSYYFDGENYWTSQEKIFKCVLPCLKTVKIIGFLGDQEGFELPLIRFLLKSARTLEKMDIDARKDLGGGGYLKGGISQFPKEMQKLLSFPRSSPDAVIMFT